MSVEEIHPASAADPHVTTFFDPGSFPAEQYQLLRHSIERRKETDGLRVVAVTSPTPGDGKTLTAVNLAVALARAPGSQVLLVDADLRRPSALARLGLDASRQGGLRRAAKNPRLTLPEVVRYVPEYNLFVLPSGQSPEAPYEVLHSAGVANLFDAVRGQFEYVVVDTPPAVGFPDYRVVEKLVDGSLLVVSAGVTPRKMVELALDAVDRKKILGIVLNRAEVGRIASYYDKYYHAARSSSR